MRLEQVSKVIEYTSNPSCACRVISEIGVVVGLNMLNQREAFSGVDFTRLSDGSGLLAPGYSRAPVELLNAAALMSP